MSEEPPKSEHAKRDDIHRFTLRIDKVLWQRFTDTLPLSLSVNEKLEKLIFDYVLKYENAVGKDVETVAADKDRQVEQNKQ